VAAYAFAQRFLTPPVDSKCETQGELDLPWRFGGKNPAERRWIICDPLWQVEICAIEQVESFGIEREACAFADREAPGER